ncbi:MAG: CoA-binding protein [Candidatus Helarchaeota archaeon]
MARMIFLPMDFSALINPKSYAIIGASRNPRSATNRLIVGLLKSGYQGKIFPINPRADEILGVKAYSDIEAVQMPIDYAFLAVPARFAVDEVKKCVRAGVKFLVIFSSGFGEIGNVNLEEEIQRTIRGSKTRILGPNCIGVYSTESKICYFSDQIPEKEGPVTFLSQSGGIMRTFIWTGFTRGFNLRAGISFGNQTDISVQELMEFFLHDSKTRIIAMYLEGVKNGKAFVTTLKKVAAQKPVVILKTGRTKRGEQAVISHTGSISGSNEVFHGLVQQTGAIQVETFEELCDVLTMLSVLEDLQGLSRNVAIVNTGGGFSVELTDIAESFDLNIPEFSQDTRERLKSVLPDVNTITINPLDLGASGFDPRISRQVFEILNDDPNTDVIITVREVERFGYLSKELGVEDVGKMHAAAMRIDGKNRKKIIVIIPKSWETSENFQRYQAFQDMLHQQHLPCFPTPIRAIKTLKMVVGHINLHENRQKK